MGEAKLKLLYEGGPADLNRLDLYEGAISLEGVARAIAITTHAYINGEVRTHGDAAKGAKLYLLPSRNGSFEHNVLVWMADATVAGVFFEFLKAAFLEAVGMSEGQAEMSKALQRRIEPTIGELPSVLESPLLEAHRTIRERPEMTLTITRTRGEKLVTFNSNTLAALQPQQRTLDEPIVGNVTRYNALSRWGKFYDRTLGHVVSFLLDDGVSERERSLITW